MKESAALIIAVALFRGVCIAMLIGWGIIPLVEEFGHELSFWPVFVTIWMCLFVFGDTRIETKENK